MNSLRLFLALIAILSIASCGKDDSGQPTDDNPAGLPDINERAFLTSADYTSLEIELIAMTGMAPTTEAKNNLVSFLSSRLNKPDGITLKTTTISAEGKSTYSLNDVDDIIDGEHTQEPSKGKLTAYIVFVDGHYTSESVLGISYGTNRMAIFQKLIQDNTGGFGEPKTEIVESTVLQHEFGHTLGLVNVGTPNVSGHEDNEHKGHCNNEDCLMYWAVETGDFLSNLFGAEVPELDANCLKDLQANGGK